MTILRPEITLLDKEHKIKIFNEAKQILEKQGVFIENQDAINLFSQYGISNNNSRFLIPSDLIETCLMTERVVNTLL